MTLRPPDGYDLRRSPLIAEAFFSSASVNPGARAGKRGTAVLGSGDGALLTRDAMATLADMRVGEPSGG